MGVGKDIQDGFFAIAGGIKEAGRKRNLELVAEQGYVAFRNIDAVAMFHADPFYANWICQYIDGEYRFYPPLSKHVPLKNEKEELLDLTSTKDLLDIYRKAIQTGQNVRFLVQMLDASSGLCQIRIVLQDKMGKQSVFLEERRFFDSQFAYELLPSIYNQVCGDFPTLDQQKEKMISFSSVDGTRGLVLGNLSVEQMKVVQDMQAYVDQALFSGDVKGR